MYRALVLGLLCAAAATAESAEAPAFFAEGSVPNEYRVETGRVSGLLGAFGIAFGLHPLTWDEDGTELTGPMGLLNYYRIFTTNHRYGESMRAQPQETRLESPDTLRVWWPAEADRPFVLTGVYRWVAPDTLDLETIVEAREDLPEFDVFLASYLSPAFPVSSFFVQSEEAGATGFVTAEPEDGVWQVSVRDEKALAMVKDGRWDIAPSPVDWAVRPDYAAPLIYRRHEPTGLTVALMARPEDCFALFSSCRGETHYSMYLSLFGQTLRAGETARNRVRLVIGDYDDEALLEKYAAFLQEE